MRGCQRGARHWCFRFQGSARILQCKWIIYLPMGHIQEILRAPRVTAGSLTPSCLLSYSHFVCLWGAIASPLSLLHYCNSPQDLDTSLSSTIKCQYLALSINRTEHHSFMRHNKAGWASKQADSEKSWVKCYSLLIQARSLNVFDDEVNHEKMHIWEMWVVKWLII